MEALSALLTLCEGDGWIPVIQEPVMQSFDVSFISLKKILNTQSSFQCTLLYFIVKQNERYVEFWLPVEIVLEWSFKGRGIFIECWSRIPCQKIKPPWASCQIGKIVGCACAGNAGNVFPATDFKRKTLVSDPNMHHGTCDTHVLWCMSGSLTTVAGKTFPAFLGHAQPAILRIWQEAHWMRIHRGQNFNRQ